MVKLMRKPVVRLVRRRMRAGTKLTRAERPMRVARLTRLMRQVILKRQRSRV